MVRILKAAIILVFCQSSLPAQVKLLLDYNAQTDEYTVSMMPERTWVSPFNKTATGQITLKATTGQFFVKDVESHVPDTRWTPSGRVNSPVESPKYDYIFFRLKTPGLTEMPYRAFRPTKLFTFTLESNCAREVMLVSNTEDAFLPPNSRSVNIGNSIGVLGARGEAYAGNISNLPIFCPYAEPPASNTNNKSVVAANSKAIDLLAISTELVESKMVYPNPTNESVNISLQWHGQAGEKDILVYNNIGELVRMFPTNLQEGFNDFKLNISEFDNGMYNFLLVDGDSRLTLGKVIKVQ
ncbi:MAG: T9SS type A sorting domain-containing protein [Bacteroidota bacterium]